eukprot:scaffold121604_cov16-Tisochrysis_lutea.AAC.1
MDVCGREGSRGAGEGGNGTEDGSHAGICGVGGRDGDAKMQEVGVAGNKEGSKGAGLGNGLQQQQQQGQQEMQESTAQGSTAEDGQDCEGIVNKRPRRPSREARGTGGRPCFRSSMWFPST